MATTHCNCGFRIADCGFGNEDDPHPIRNPKSEIRNRAFTLVELLVVITIIGILAALITVAAVGALKSSRRTEVKAEVNQIDGGFNEVKNKTNAFPPNCQTDSTGPINEARVLGDIKRYMKLAFPRHQEPDAVIAALVGLNANGTPIAAGQNMAGGMAASEAIVFWLGGFSQDPKFPISGDGGPAYDIPSLNNAQNYTLDPVESRKWIFPCKVERLVPRNTTDNYFDESKRRFLEYQVTINGQTRFRRINFWQYVPRKLDQPYMYFDTSRYTPVAPVPTPGSNVDPLDPPAATAITGFGDTPSDPFYVYAFKKASEANSASSTVQFINPDKFQIIHCGINDKYDQETFKNRISSKFSGGNMLLFPAGPYTGDIAETIVNFTTETKLEDAQK